MDCHENSALSARQEPAGRAARELLSEAEASTLTGLSRRTLQRFRVNGGGPLFVKLGTRRVAYARAAIDTWISARTYRSTADATVSSGGRS